MISYLTQFNASASAYLRMDYPTQHPSPIFLNVNYSKNIVSLNNTILLLHPSIDPKEKIKRSVNDNLNIARHAQDLKIRALPLMYIRLRLILTPYSRTEPSTTLTEGCTLLATFLRHFESTLTSWTAVGMEINHTFFGVYIALTIVALVVFF